jgi:adenine deaminase
MKQFILNNLIQSARSRRKIDLILKNARLVNVFTCEIYRTSVAIADGYIVGFGHDYPAKEIINLHNLYLAPGFIEGHIHIESSFLTPLEFSRVVLPCGTTTVICDPHEIANVIGLKGIRFFLEANQYSPLTIYVMLPSCVPATSLETSGAKLLAKELRRLAKHPYVLGLAEMMNYPGVLNSDKETLSKISSFPLVDGHAPNLHGKDLYGYITAGIKSDHESLSLNEAKEKLQNGMYLMIREASAAKNLGALVKAITPQNSRRCLLVSDDRHAQDLLKHGHLNDTLKKAVRLGLDPSIAIQLVTINPAEYFGLKRLGAIAPGFYADLVVLENLKNFTVRMVFKRGQLITNLCTKTPRTSRLINIDSVKLPKLEKSDFEIRLSQDPAKIKVIEVVPHQIITRKIVLPALIRHGRAYADTKRDISKLAVIDRHTGKKHIGLGFVKGFGLKKGAIASTVAHDSHNLIIIGTNDKDMLFAAQAIRSMKGGQAVILNNRLIASLPLPIAGIMSDCKAREIVEKTRKLNRATQRLGCTIKEPFMTMSFLALPLIPELRLTDKGLVDVLKFQTVPVYIPVGCG